MGNAGHAAFGPRMLSAVRVKAGGRTGPQAIVAALAVLVLVLAAGCGDDGGSASGDPSSTTAGDATDGDASAENACPVDGCEITITDVVAEGDELRVTWDANFTPDASRNHIHVYWDTYTADQVSNDAASRNVQQGEWVPTDAYPEYVTEGATSVTAAGESTTLCATAGDSDHNVIDSSIQHCFDVADLL